MQEKIGKKYKIAYLERIHSLPKLLICLGIGLIAFFIFKTKKFDWLSNVMIGWDTFSLSMIVLIWATFFVTTSKQIREQSKVQDSSRILVFIIILIANIAGFLAVLLLIITKKKSVGVESVQLLIAVVGMLLSWFLIHTIFTLRYAHIYYGDDKTKADAHAGGLLFPGNERPEYFDFAYFSFVLGMTFQVSDVQITSKRFRKLALLHGLLSFGFNTIMIALTINLIAGYGG